MARPNGTKSINSPEELEKLFHEYQAWVNKNPFLEHDFVGKDAKEVRRQKQRPTTWSGFEGYLAKKGIVAHLAHYEQNTGNAYVDYLPIIVRIKHICAADVIDGALAQVYNGNLASRIHGLKEHTEVKHDVTGFLNIDPLADTEQNDGSPSNGDKETK